MKRSKYVASHGEQSHGQYYTYQEVQAGGSSCSDYIPAPYRLLPDPICCRVRTAVPVARCIEGMCGMVQLATNTAGFWGPATYGIKVEASPASTVAGRDNTLRPSRLG